MGKNLFSVPAPRSIFVWKSHITSSGQIGFNQFYFNVFIYLCILLLLFEKWNTFQDHWHSLSINCILLGYVLSLVRSDLMGDDCSIIVWLGIVLAKHYFKELSCKFKTVKDFIFVIIIEMKCVVGEWRHRNDRLRIDTGEFKYANIIIVNATRITSINSD